MKIIFDFIFLSVSHSDMYECKNKQLKVKMFYSKMLQSIDNYSKNLWFHSMHYSFQKITLVVDIGDCFSIQLSRIFFLFSPKISTHNIDHNYCSKIEGKKIEN